MLLILLAIFTLNLVNCETIDDGKCNNFHADFEMNSVTGVWYVTAIFPEPKFPENKTVTCHKVEFSETDVGGLRWLINSTVNLNATVKPISGPVVRQRYNSGKPFDVWSKAVEGVNGCFEQVLSLSSNGEEFEETIRQQDKMQLHMIEGEKPLLLQLLWGRVISAVLYSRNKDIKPKQLDRAKRVLNKLRGPPPEPKFCDEFNVKILNYTQKYQ